MHGFTEKTKKKKNGKKENKIITANKIGVNSTKRPYGRFYIDISNALGKNQILSQTIVLRQEALPSLLLASPHFLLAWFLQRLFFPLKKAPQAPLLLLLPR